MKAVTTTNIDVSDFIIAIEDIIIQVKSRTGDKILLVFWATWVHYFHFIYFIVSESR